MFKTFVFMALVALFGSNAMAAIYCQVPYGYPDSFRKVQKIAIEQEGSEFVVTFPAQGECQKLSAKVLECALEVDGTEYVTQIDLKAASSPSYTQAGAIVKHGLFAKKSKVLCLTQ